MRRHQSKAMMALVLLNGFGVCHGLASKKTQRNAISAHSKTIAKKIIITKGTVGNISNELKAVLMYMDGGVATNKYTKDLDKEVVSVKSDEKVRMQYMLLMEAYAEQRLLGRGKTIVRQIRKVMNQASIDQMTFLWMFLYRNVKKSSN